MVLILLGICYLGFAWSVEWLLRGLFVKMRVSGVLFILLLGLGDFGLGLLYDYFNAPFIWGAGVRHILFVIFIMLVISESWEKKLLAAALIMAVRVFLWNFACSFCSEIRLVWGYLVSHGKAQWIDENTNYLISCISFMVIILSVIKLKKVFVRVFCDKLLKWYSTVSLPLFLLVFVVDFVNGGASNGIMVVSNAGSWDVWYNQLFSHGAICLLTFLAACIAGGLVFGMDRLYVEQKKSESYRGQVAFYKMLEEQYLKMERLRHDMKNHLICLQEMWNGKQWDEMGSYLGKMSESGNIGEPEEVSGNRIVDALLYEKKKQGTGIAWESDVRLQTSDGINDFDICVILGNLLDNALEECGRFAKDESRFIRVKGMGVKKCLLLEVGNPTRLKDIKELKKGIGLMNVSETVEKYNGVLELKIEDGVFLASVLLPCLSRM